MVRPQSDRGVGTPASFLRKSFSIDAIKGDETLRISALGLYICFINGKRVGRDILTPGWTSYDVRLSYQTYAVSDLLVAGENTIEIWLADGWLRSQLMWGKFPIHNTYGEQTAAIAELRSGDELVLVTDGSWQSGELPIRKSGIYFGEIYDARLSAEVSDGSEAISFDVSRLVAHETTPVRELDVLQPVKQWTDAEGRVVYDFAQNVGGYIAYRVRGEAGTKVSVEHAEVLDKDGNFYNVNYRTAEARTEYTLAGQGEETYRPHFTFHGFRYARITIEGKAEVSGVISVPISSVTEVKSGFTSGNKLVDRLFLNTVWSQRGNFIEVPTDCPQRDERLGWTGDAQVFAGTAMYLAEAQGFFQKWMRDLMVDQRADGAVPHVVPDPTRLQPEHYPGFYGSTGWGDAVYVVPWQLYLHYGDTDFLAEALPAMIKWVDFVWSISDGPIVSPPREWGDRGFSFGDWLQPKGPSAKPLPTIGDDAAATIYLHIAAKSVAEIARIVGDTATAQRLATMAEQVRIAFASEFITASGRLAYDDQTSYALAIVHDLIPAEKLAAATRYFKGTIDRADRRIGTGFIGTPALLPALVKVGEWGLVSDVFLQEEVPGWLYQVKMGATTIWERWDAIQADGSIYNPQMNSYNHYAYGAVCQWLLEGVAGFRPDEKDPAFKTVIFEPIVLPELSPVKAHHDSPAGLIRAEWAIEGEAVRYEIEVPQGSVGVLRLAESYRDATLDGQPIAAGGDQALTAGRHVVHFNYTAPKREERHKSLVNANTP
ncbi:MAG: family 78 glycoside hydrolase catalytic domain [Candidatus Devosia phytovorans]|uniref:alpha-L-rhamnosidase n=1 Tax=Candidatus Devosia phytovorans TaxID=3121372 RepID=A0AAJ5VYV4_9HYPH|nr:alpha-L-rhamnosidase [Devosia sp.]WEK06715.1 MAG: family 78 glycoside hydrolase catalytic domain [Devosia sp.]